MRVHITYKKLEKIKMLCGPAGSISRKIAQQTSLYVEQKRVLQRHWRERVTVASTLKIKLSPVSIFILRLIQNDMSALVA